MSKNISKVTYYGDVLIDLTNDTVDEQHLLSGTIAHNKYGASIVGTNTYDADTSDANATNNDILSGKTAYANGTKLIGACTYDSDTSDATASVDDILLGKTAYVDGSKLTGICTYDADTSDANATSFDILTGKTAYVNGTKLTGSCTYDANTSDADATASDILTGKTAYIDGLKVAGTCDYDSNTSDANATNLQILDGSTAYVKGNKITGTMQNVGSVNGVINNVSTPYNIQQGYHNGNGIVDINPTEKAKIIPENIKKNIEILGVVGTHEGGGIGQQKTATPSGEQQVILPDSGYDYLTQVTVNKIPSTEIENQRGTTLVIGS